MIGHKEILHTVQISAPEELRKSLPDIRNNGVGSHFAAVAVNNPEMRVCPFQLDGVQKKEIKNRLIGEAVELLSLPANSVELDYQLFESTPEKTRGVFVCYPKKLLEDYMTGLDGAGYVPVKIVPSILAGIDSFLAQYKGKDGRFCVFDFSKEHVIYFAVFSKGHCDFLREIHYENIDEIEHEVVQSLRCACSMSSIKAFDHVFLSGDVPNREQLIQKLKELFCEDVTHGYFTDVESSLRNRESVFALNLIKNKTFSMQQRQAINQAMRIGMAVCGLVIIMMSIKIFLTAAEIKKYKAMNSPSDYNYALDLKQRLEAL